MFANVIRDGYLAHMSITSLPAAYEVRVCCRVDGGISGARWVWFWPHTRAAWYCLQPSEAVTFFRVFERRIVWKSLDFRCSYGLVLPVVLFCKNMKITKNSVADADTLKCPKAEGCTEELCCGKQHFVLSIRCARTYARFFVLRKHYAK